MLINEVLTQMKHSMQSQAAYFTGFQKLPQDQIMTLKWKYTKNIKDTLGPYPKPS